MKYGRWLAVPAALAAGLTIACGPPSIRVPGGARPDLIVLLPDPDGGTVGRATVSNPSGSVDLAGARASTVVADRQSPARVTIMSEAEVQRIFGEALAALPPPPKQFTLFFRFDSEELTTESRMLIREVLQTVKQRAFSDVAVIGHTDTMGSTARNFELGRKRANAVRTLLIGAGLNRSSIEIKSFGESSLLVKTANDVFEPRNRRVDVTVK